MQLVAYSYVNVLPEAAMVTPLMILSLLVIPLLVAYAVNRRRRRLPGQTPPPLNVQRYACWGLGVAFMYFFLGHLVKTQDMVAMLPPWLPARTLLVYASGLLELAIAIALFIPRWQTLAARCAIVVFILFFPVNIYAAWHGVGLGGHQWGPVYLWIRAPLQLLLIAWAYGLCVRGMCVRDVAQPQVIDRDRCPVQLDKEKQL